MEFNIDNIIKSEGAITIILGNGAFPQNPAVVSLLQRAAKIICCDGAVDKLLTIGLEPSVIVGDFDSMRAETRTSWHDRLANDPSEEYNDMQKALKYCQKNHLDDILLLGFGGLREDHFIANVSIMATYSDNLKLTMVTDYGVFNTIHKTTTLDSEPGQQVSIFSKDENLPLTFHGLKYPVEQRCFKHLWEGSLNEAIDTSFTIELHDDAPVIIYRSFC